MPEHILFLTGHLAEPSLRRVLEQIDPPFDYSIRVLGINVAALLTTEFVVRRLTDTENATRVLLPGRSNTDPEALGRHFGVPFEHGPEELKDLPQFFGGAARETDLSRYDVDIFAEIVDAPSLDTAALLARATAYRNDGADVIDLGCQPGRPFPHLEEAVRELKAAGFRVSVDSVDTGELLRGGQAGADYLLSLTERTLWIADEVPSTPVLIPARPGDLDSLVRAVETLEGKGRPCFADPILDPIHFGFTDSVVRYRELRRRFPQVRMFMGIGNLTELTEADTTGINALLMGMVSELGITGVLTTQVSPHACRAVREADAARRVMFAARESHSLPRGFGESMLPLHALRPFPDTRAEIEQLAASVRDPSFRIQVSEDGIHVYNRDGIRTGADPFELYPDLGLEGDASHAFYMGVELARAQIAWQLGKRYTQDRDLDWGHAARASTGERKA